MSESTSNPSPPSPPQTSNIFVDRPCLKCGYNLRGQTATWSRRALNWQATCPECGGVQVVVMGSKERLATLQSPAGFLSLLVVAAIALLLASWLGDAVKEMMGPEGSIGFYSPSLWVVQFTHFVLRGLPVLAVSIGIGLFVCLSPFATLRQRDTLMVILVMCGWCLGIWLEAVSPDMRTRPMPEQLRWVLINSGVGFIIAIIGGRLGLSLGRPFARLLTSMYILPKEKGLP